MAGRSIADRAARARAFTSLGMTRAGGGHRPGDLRVLTADPDLGLGAGDQHVRDGHLGGPGGRGALVRLRADLPQDLHGAGRLGAWPCWGRSRRSTCRCWTRASRACSRCLRSNFWLTIHVLTEVSSYAAFGLAWALGLIAMGYYLTATYRRSPRFAELALPLIPGASAAGRRGRGSRRVLRRVRRRSGRPATCSSTSSRSWEGSAGWSRSASVLAIGGEADQPAQLYGDVPARGGGDRSGRESRRARVRRRRLGCQDVRRPRSERAGGHADQADRRRDPRDARARPGASSTPGAVPCRRRR